MSKRLDYTQIAPAGVKALGGVYGTSCRAASVLCSSIWSICGSRRSTTAPTV